jgi:hypothetical protein
VRVVNQPFVFGWHDGALHIQAFDILEQIPGISATLARAIHAALH